mmetsp:Transcript_51716/g.60416  ORF Transcript_51716/g.60416 Transcript_51716/m.60416 type:complete len:108 (-) Transcript_51716:1102-1425(-)
MNVCVWRATLGLEDRNETGWRRIIFDKPLVQTKGGRQNEIRHRISEDTRFDRIVQRYDWSSNNSTKQRGREQEMFPGTAGSHFWIDFGYAKTLLVSEPTPIKRGYSN